MGYESCLEAAGATVHDFTTIGDYQGTWYALVSFGGVTGIVSGGYGSCSGCDSYDAECERHWNEEGDGKDWKAKFGRSYLDDIQSPKDFVAYHQERLADASPWSKDETKELLQWISKAIEPLGIIVPSSMAPFRATFQYDFGVKFDPEVGTPIEPGRQYVFDKIRAEIEDIGLEQWLDDNLFGIRHNG